MINSYYTGALQAFVAMGEHLEKDMTEYRELLDKSIDYMENQLYDGEYFIQNIRWKELQASDPTKVQSVNSNYSKEGIDYEAAVLAEEFSLRLALQYTMEMGNELPMERKMKVHVHNLAD
jgi:hypothetical protein